jgi:predicted Fe-Mo cluster-binding NifX family protein
MSWRIALASADNILVTEHFGRSYWFYIIDAEADGSFRNAEKRFVKPLCEGGEHSRDGLEAALASLGDCAAVIAAKIGPPARAHLEKAGLAVFEQAGPIDALVRQVAAYFARTGRPES